VHAAIVIKQITHYTYHDLWEWEQEVSVSDVERMYHAYRASYVSNAAQHIHSIFDTAPDDGFTSHLITA